MQQQAVLNDDYTATVLCVDDEPAVLSALARTLRPLKCRMHYANDSREALSILEQHPVDLVISDMQMPVVDGSVLLAQIARDWPNTMRIVLTGQADLDTAIRLINEAGVYRYIEKPWSNAELCNSVQRALELKQLTDEKRLLDHLLYSQNTLLQESNKVLERFNGAVSHDLRGPLRLINGYGSALRDALEEGDHGHELDLLNRLTSATRRMGEMLEALLAYSRSGQQPLQASTFDLVPIIRTIECELRDRDGRQNVVFEVPPQMSIHADRGLMQIVYRNLLENAWRFTRDSETPRICVGYRETDGDTVYFVKDNGIGFEQSRADRLFEPFVRGDNVDTFDGTGLGLSTVAGVIRRHGGAIRATGTPNAGAVFEFHLPPSTQADQ